HPSPPIPASVTGDYGKNLPRLTVPRRILKSASERRDPSLCRRQASARMCQLSAGNAARRHRPALRGAAAETEQRLEERDATRRANGGPPLARCHDLLLALALLQRLDHAALALDRRQCAAVDIVDVAAGLQLSGVIDECVLIGQQDPDLRRQLNVLLAGAEH